MLGDGNQTVSRRLPALTARHIDSYVRRICEKMRVSGPSKIVFHSLRHLFAGTYGVLEKELFRLGDIPGHININTTRIYTAGSGPGHTERIERLERIIMQVPHGCFLLCFWLYYTNRRKTEKYISLYAQQPGGAKNSPVPLGCAVFYQKIKILWY